MLLFVCFLHIHVHVYICGQSRAWFCTASLIMPHIFKHFMCLGIFACMHGHTMYVLGTYRGQERELDLGSPGIGVTGGCEPPCGCWEPIMVLLEEHQEVLATKQFLQPVHLSFWDRVSRWTWSSSVDLDWLTGNPRDPLFPPPQGWDHRHTLCYHSWLLFLCGKWGS